jgi:predicted SprT family Zn-dependent metalloprotease
MTRTELLKQCQAQAAMVWETFCEIYPQLVKFDCPKIVLNARFSKTAGNCEVEHNTINLGLKFFAKNYNRMMQEIIPHEIAHQVDYNLNGLPLGNRWHGANWQVIMSDYGLEPKPYHNMEI